MLTIAKCGIKKYDELPGRVGRTDVDAVRAALNYLGCGPILNRIGSFFLGGGLYGWPRISVEHHREELRSTLDRAAEEYEERDENSGGDKK